MTTLTDRLPLERMKDVVDRALKAERGLDGSDPRLRTYANARAKVEKEFWGYHADLLAEITRLTSEVDELRDDAKVMGKTADRWTRLMEAAEAMREAAAQYCEDRAAPEWLSDGNDMLETDRAANMMCARGIRALKVGDIIGD